ncbi:MAG: cytochrome c [Deltaproteobacteria bacterium]|nr:cytochrome c [Deltaproteobacteria bacterium]
MTLFELPVLLGIVVAMALLRLVRASLLVWVLAWWIGIYVFVSRGFATPVPASAQHIYLGIVTLALFAYVTSSGERIRSFVDPLVNFAGDGRYTLALVPVLLALPALAAYREYVNAKVPVEPPFFARTVHPSPPTEITVHDQKIDMLGGDNPLRHLEKDDPAKFAEHVARGKDIYYEQCFFCHADALGGDGMYAHGLNPAPANFIDQGVLPSFQETFFFWRIAKGGPGMPDEGAPGDSAMPEWERFLSNEQMWEVVLFLYDHTGYRPRAREVHAEGH